MSGRTKVLILLSTAALAASSIASAAAVSAAGPASAPAPAIPTLVAPLDGATVSGRVDVTIGAVSDAVLVGFRADGIQDVSTTPGTGPTTLSWPTWAGPNGPAHIMAFACSTPSICAFSPTVTVDVANVAPVLTAPVKDAVLTGLVPAAATSPEGGVAFLVGGVLLGYDATAPYSALLDVGLVPDGAHNAVAVRCLRVDWCWGPSSEPVPVVTTSLHPLIKRQYPVHFSPNADGVMDTTRTTFSLTTAQAAAITVLTKEGVTVRGPVSLGLLAAGTHGWTWNGRSNAGVRAPDAVYKVVLRTKANGRYGVAITTVSLDTVKPRPTTVTGNGATFYPKRDGYKDAFVPTFVLAERATVTMRVTNSAGTLVRTVSGRFQPGTNKLTWSGRTANNALLPVGTYAWRLKARDLAGNTWASPKYTVRLSWKKLVPVTLTATVDAGPATTSTSTAACAVVAASSYGTVGTLLSNTCDFAVVGSQKVEVPYVIRVPAAISYGAVTLKAYGSSTLGADTYGWVRTADGSTAVVLTKETPATAGSWVTFGTVGAGSVTTARTVQVGIGVGTGLTPPNVVDLRYVKVLVAAKKLG